MIKRKGFSSLEVEHGTDSLSGLDLARTNEVFHHLSPLVLADAVCPLNPCGGKRHTAMQFFPLLHSFLRATREQKFSVCLSVC